MIRPVIRDPVRLSLPSAKAGFADLPAAQDLLDTFLANRGACVGMAANMIGVCKRIIVLELFGAPVLMLNPAITAKKGPYRTKEGCLSLPGQRETERFREITVCYQDTAFCRQTKTLTGFSAQIVQHEIDHGNGILI